MINDLNDLNDLTYLNDLYDLNDLDDINYLSKVCTLCNTHWTLATIRAQREACYYIEAALFTVHPGIFFLGDGGPL